MSEYIKKEDAIKEVLDVVDAWWYYSVIREAIINMPAADVAERRRAYNKEQGTPSQFECSACGWSDWDTMTGTTEPRYCPGCGAEIGIAIQKKPYPKLKLGTRKEKKNMDQEALLIVEGYIEEHLDKSDELPEFEVYTVWKCKVLQNWKYLIASTLPDGMYYEMTYNGDKKEWYLDAYKKFENRCIRG